MMRSLLRLSIIASVVCLCGTSASAQTTTEQFEVANSLAYQGDYAAAVKGFEGLVEAGMDDPALFLNLGNAQYRLGAFGQAIWSFRRGLRCDPSESLRESLGHNLKRARTELQARYRASNDGSQFIYSEPGGWLYQLSHVTSLEALLTLFLVLWWALASCLVMRRLSKGEHWGSIAVPLAVLILLVGGLFVARLSTDANFRLGVVVADGVVMREGPDVHARGVDVPEGIEVRVLDDTPGWHKIEIPSGRSGWVAEKVLSVL
ncbi:MAG: hypothetical protein ACPGU1_00140 [Myxococcota bacterium]